MTSALEPAGLAPPAAPGALSVTPAITCAAQPTYTSSSPSLSASAAAGTDPAAPISFTFQVWTNPGSATKASLRATNPTPIAGSSVGSLPPFSTWSPGSLNSTDRQPLEDGSSYGFRVRVATPTGPGGALERSPWTATPGDPAGWARFAIDSVAPSPVRIDSFVYPRDAWGAAANAPGDLFLSAADAAAFSYAFDTGEPPIPVDTLCDYAPDAPGQSIGFTTAINGRATVAVPELGAGPHTLTVRAFDHAHVATQRSTYTFYVAPVIGSVEPAAASNAWEVVPTSQPTAGHVAAQPGAGYSGGSRSLIAARGRTAATFDFEAPVSGRYAVGVRLGRARHFGVVRVAIDGSTVVDGSGQPLEIDTFGRKTGWRFTSLAEYLPPAGLDLSQGTHQLTLRIVRTRGSSYTYPRAIGTIPAGYTDRGFSTAIDVLTLAPLSLSP
jgi:hypothetical protein